MLFNTFDFVLFFAIVLAASAILPHRPRLYFLLGSSYFFYGYWNWQYTALLLLSTAIDFFAALGIQKATTSSRKKLFLIISILMNLSLLGIFKYYNFFAQSVAPWVHWNMPELQVLLPVGISFYTFQSMSYTIDVYRGILEPRRSFVDFALYVSFFPQLVAGPIVRAKDFLPQLDSKPRVTTEQIRSGMHLILRGYIEKVVIADNLGPIVEKIYSNSAAHSGADLWIATYCFAFQIFCDFAGYTDIARGCARLLGYEFLENFRRPYLAANIVDFWRRWHISLSTWLRDYLYIPLGGSQKGTERTYLNLMLTMVLGGLWHGANWTFFWWGLYHGVLLSVTRFFQHTRAEVAPHTKRRWVAARPFAVLITFHLVCIGWVMFRAENIQVAIQMLQSMFRFPLGSATLLPYAYLCGFLYFAMTLHEYADAGIRFERWPLPVRAFMLLLALLALAIFVPAKRVAFIYFQF
jgi:alginate O-acetyltransferase complex protein AlgI